MSLNMTKRDSTLGKISRFSVNYFMINISLVELKNLFTVTSKHQNTPES